MRRIGKRGNMKLKKKIFFLIIAFIWLTKMEVLACGEIEELHTDVGTITIVDSSNYLVTVPAGTKEVTLTGKTNYAWVDGYAPKKVSTSGVTELKVDGNACGYGIYTYFVEFKELSNKTTENEKLTNDQASSETATPDSTHPEEGVQTEGKNPLLKNLKIPSYEILFDQHTFEYEVEVDSEVDSLDIIAEPEDDLVEISISSNAKNLKEGENLISITLKDASGNTSVYYLTVYRMEPKSNNNYLASIIVAGYQLNFDPSITLYELEIGKESSLNIQAVTESELAHYEIIGNAGLTDGSTVKIRVTAEDDSTKDYVISITKKFNIMDYWIYIVIVLLVLLLLILLLIIKQKKQKKKGIEPETIDTPNSTAGIVEEITTQNSAPLQEYTEPASLDVNLQAPNTNAQLRIIEPTNIETKTEVLAQPIDEDDNPTEIFKL